MWIPGQALSKDVIDFMIAALNCTEVKAELAKQIRVEIDVERSKYKGNRQTYESLTSGDVNTQARKAVSGYDSYGKVVITDNNGFNNGSVYQKMKNKIIYGKTPEEGYRNRGGMSIV